MAKYKHKTLARLKELQRRQDPPKWGRDYEPAIRATREEAPARSRFLQIWFEKLKRYVHALSSVEGKVPLPYSCEQCGRAGSSRWCTSR